MPTSVLLAVLTAAGLLALAPALVRRYDATERLAALDERAGHLINDVEQVMSDYRPIEQAIDAERSRQKVGRHGRADAGASIETFAGFVAQEKATLEGLRSRLDRYAELARAVA